MKLVLTPEAEEHADECDRWWREHREVQDLFAYELAATSALLAEAPNIGSVYAEIDGVSIRVCCSEKRGRTSTTRWMTRPRR